MMKNSQEIRHQRSIYYHAPASYGSHSRRRGHTEGFQTDMFLEDVHLRIMPIGGRARQRPFKIEVNPRSKEVRHLISTALSRHTFAHSLEDSLSDFFGGVAQEVCGFDRAVYEIVYYEDTDSKKLTGFELFFIPEWQITEKRQQFFQIVPPEIAKERKVEELIPLTRDNLVFFELDSNLRTTLRDMRENLSRLSGFEFVPLVTEAQKGKVPYDFKVHQRAMDLALAEACREVGWTGRGALYGKVLSYYWIHKNLVFGKFLAGIRTCLLDTLNEALTRIGPKLGFEAQLTISGLPTAEEIDAAMEQLRRGTTAFTEIMDPFRY